MIKVKELSFCHKLWFSNPYFYVSIYRRPLIFQTINSFWSNNDSLKYQRFTSSDCKDIVIIKSEFVAKTQFLYRSHYTIHTRHILVLFNSSSSKGVMIITLKIPVHLKYRHDFKAAGAVVYSTHRLQMTKRYNKWINEVLCVKHIRFQSYIYSSLKS